MAASIPSFTNLTFSEVSVVTNTGTDIAPVWALNSALVIGAAVAAINDPISTQRIFNPVAEGNPVQSSDAFSKWLPSIASITAAEQVDNGIGQQFPGIGQFGQVTLSLKPATANTVEAASPMTFRLSPQAAVTLVSAGTF